MNRRSLFGALVAGFWAWFTCRSGEGASVLSPVRPMKYFEFVKRLEEAGISVKPRDEPLVVVVLGGTLPNQFSTSIRPVLGSPADPQKPSAGMTLEQAADYPPDYVAGQQVYYPRSPRFACHPTLMVGTIEDVIAEFGRLLRKVNDEGLQLTRRVMGYGPEQQAKIREVWEAHRNGAAVAHLPWDHDGRCQQAEDIRHQLDNPTASGLEATAKIEAQLRAYHNDPRPGIPLEDLFKDKAS